MSNQIVISSGAKLRNLDGVITGSTGILSSVPLGGANGVATLDSSGKVPVSQLPASVVTYLGTWNAATNTPTLANGTGDPGDMYLCNVAGTVNFGAGPITFAVGDWVLYGSGTWQKSNGQNGTVTSVAVTESSDALSITGSPITTAGTINIGFAGTSAQYVAGDGSLITFPTLTGYVPYTGATQTLDMGAYDVNARGFKVNGTAGNGHVDFKHQSGTPTGSASSSTLFADSNGDLAWKNDHNYITTLNSHANTADRVYTFPDASGTLALTSDLSGYVTLGTTQTITGSKTFSNPTTFTNTLTASYINTNSASGLLIGDDGSGSVGALKFAQNTNTSVGNSSQSSLSVNSNTQFRFYYGISSGVYKGFLFDNSALNTNTYRTYTMPNASGTLALTSDIPSLSGYVPYSGATTDVNLGSHDLTAHALTTTSTITSGNYIQVQTNGSLLLYASGGSAYQSGYTTVQGETAGISTIQGNGVRNYLTFPTSTGYTYTYPATSGTLALTSQLTSGTVTSVGLSSSTSGVTIGSTPITTSGTITLAIATASGSQQGLLSSTDWTTFNSKVSSQWTTSGSNIYYNTGNVGIGVSSPSYKLEIKAASSTNSIVLGSIASTGGYNMISVNGTNAEGQYIGIAGGGGGDNNFYLQAGNTGQLVFRTGDGTNFNERMRITNAGNVGIGTTSPIGAGGGYVGLNISGATGSSLVLTSNTSNTYLYALNASNDFAIENAGAQIFRAGSSERMRITSGGNVCVNRTSGDGVFNVNGAIYLYNFSTGAGTNAVKYNSSTGLLSYDTSSIRYKDNVRQSVYGLNDVLKLKSVMFEYKQEKTTDVGLIAEDVYEVIPELVQLDSDNKPNAVSYDRIVSVLIKAIQEQQAQIEELKAKIN